jgi:periplasmic protein TonB
VFDEVTKQEGGKRAARRGAFLMGSTVVQVLLVFAVVTISARIGARAIEEKIVDVKFVRQAPPPPPPPPPPPKKKAPSKPKTDAPKQFVPPMAMIQPKDVPAELKPPDPNEKVPEEETGSDEGVEGGVVGGVAGAQGFEEAPQYMTAGFRKPHEVQPGCVGRSMRMPPALVGFISGPITVKFAVHRDGSVGQVQVMSQVADPRIVEVIRQGLASCPWVPGADAQGRPVSIWVIQPFRFTGG